MQLPKTTLPSPIAVPPAPVRPAAKAPLPAQPKRYGWLLLLGLVVAAAAGYLWFRQNQAKTEQAAVQSSLRTHTVRGGKLDRTLRLTGSTTAAKAAALLAPRMRGSRSGFGRDSLSFSGGGNRGSSGGGSSASSSSGGSSTSGAGTASAIASTSAAASPGGSGGGDASASMASGGLQSSRGASAMRSATSRVGTRSSSSSSRSSSSRTAGGSSGSDLGSTASSLPGGSSGPPSVGGSGGRGGGGEFTLVLQNAAKPGSLVKKGDVVAEFDRQYMLLRLEDYNSSVLQTEASFKQMQADLDVSKNAHNLTIYTAKADLDKATLDMKTLPVLSAMDAERRRLALEEARARNKQLQQEVKFVDIGIKADRRVAELQVKQSKLELQRAEANANRMLMKAPIDGLVVMQTTFRGSEFDQIKVGDQIYPGMMFMQIVDPSAMVINANVSQVDVGKLRIGQRARVRFDAFPDLELPAHIYAVGSVGKPSRSRPDWVKELSVSLRLDQMDPRVIPDLSVSCDVILEQAEAEAIVPREAIFAGTGRDGKTAKPFVVVRSAKGVWERREVELGLENAVRVAVKSGLKQGEVVALEPPSTTAPEKKQAMFSGSARRAARES